mmetsp:Transcript_141401/g.352567  ORF Transcript_141401/g.352567 Transcript_141401/m.352567 type:complete len:364 (+) Transcript_141401:72-1163(+)
MGQGFAAEGTRLPVTQHFCCGTKGAAAAAIAWEPPVDAQPVLLPPSASSAAASDSAITMQGWPATPSGCQCGCPRPLTDRLVACGYNCRHCHEHSDLCKSLDRGNGGSGGTCAGFGEGEPAAAWVEDWVQPLSSRDIAEPSAALPRRPVNAWNLAEIPLSHPLPQVAKPMADDCPSSPECSARSGGEGHGIYAGSGANSENFWELGLEGGGGTAAALPLPLPPGSGSWPASFDAGFEPEAVGGDPGFFAGHSLRSALRRSPSSSSVGKRSQQGGASTPFDTTGTEEGSPDDARSIKSVRFSDADFGGEVQLGLREAAAPLGMDVPWLLLPSPSEPAPLPPKPVSPASGRRWPRSPLRGSMRRV